MTSQRFEKGLEAAADQTPYGRAVNLDVTYS